MFSFYLHWLHIDIKFPSFHCRGVIICGLLWYSTDEADDSTRTIHTVDFRYLDFAYLE